MRRLGRVLTASAVAVALLLLAAAPAAAAPGHRTETQATVTSFEADFYLDRDGEGRSSLTTVETFVMDFAAGAGEHGPIRSLVESYDGHPTDLDVESVVDENGTAYDVDSESEDGYYSLRIGDEDVEIEGEHTYVITYTQHNVTLFPDDSDTNEFFWDVNGTQWEVPFGTVTGRVHVPADLVGELTGQTACYSGSEGSSDRCESDATSNDDTGDQPGGVVYTATASGLSAEQTLTIAVGFTEGTFEPRATTPFTALFWIEVALAAIAVLFGLITLSRRRTIFASAPGRPTIIAEYLPPAGVSVITSAIVTRTTRKAVAAQLIDLAVRRNIRIIEREDSGDGSKKGRFTLQLLSIEGLRADETALAQAFLGTGLKTGATKTLTKSDTKLSKSVYSTMQKVKASDDTQQYFARVSLSARLIPLLVGVGAAIGSGILFLALLADARDFLIPLLVFVPAALAAIVICSVVFRVPLTAAGAELRDHLAGLRLYIQVAERDRIRMLQSPEGTERTPVDTSDRTVMLHLYERVLPYAVLFNEEKSWAKTLGDYYDEQPPEWYRGKSAFNAVAFASGINAVTSFTTASYSGTASSSSSGAGGGGYAGGGGGGGGGGSW